MKQVVIAWGGWSCTAGYIHWAYVAEYVECNIVNTVTPGCEKIGAKMFDAPMRKDITDTKNCDFGKTPKPFPKPLCEKWIKEQGFELMATIKMRTD